MLRALKPGLRKPPFPAGLFGDDDLPAGQMLPMAECMALRLGSLAQRKRASRLEGARWEVGRATVEGCRDRSTAPSSASVLSALGLSSSHYEPKPEGSLPARSLDAPGSDRTDRADGKVSAGTPSPQPTPTPSLGGAGQSMGHGILLAT